MELGKEFRQGIPAGKGVTADADPAFDMPFQGGHSFVDPGALLYELLGHRDQYPAGV